MISCLKIDERAVHDFKIPVLTLMERAGNAGDGLVAARRLYPAKIPVSLILLKPADSFKDAVLANFNEIVRLGLPYEEAPEYVSIKKKILESVLTHLILSRPMSSLGKAPAHSMLSWIQAVSTA